MQLELTTEQCDELQELIEGALDELATEIHHATDHAFREKLRARRTLLEQIRQQLQAARATS